MSSTTTTNRVLLTLKVHILSPHTTSTSSTSTSIRGASGDTLPSWQSFVFPSYGALAVSISTSASTQGQPSAYPVLQHGLLHTGNTARIEGVLFEGDNDWHWQQLSRMCKEHGKCSDASKCYHVLENGSDLLELDASSWGEVLMREVSSGRISNLEESIVVAGSMSQAQHLLQLQRSSALCDHLNNFVEDLDEAVIRLGRRTGKSVASARDTLNARLVSQVARSGEEEEAWDETIMNVFETLVKPYIETQMSKTYGSTTTTTSSSKNKKSKDKDIEMQLSRVEINSPRTADKMLPVHSTRVGKSMAMFDDQVVSAASSPILGSKDASHAPSQRAPPPRSSTSKNEQSMFIRGSGKQSGGSKTRQSSQEDEQEWVEA